MNYDSFNFYKHGPCFFVFILLIGSLSCNKIVNVGPPTTGLATSTVFQSNATASSAVTGIYSALASQSFLQSTNGLSVFLGLSADELTDYSNDPVLKGVYANKLSSTNQYFWNAIFNYLYDVNAALEGFASSQNVGATYKKQLVGESKFLRAFLNFYLTNIYGDVPLVTSTDYKVNNTIKKTSAEKMYEQVVKDLIDAKDSLQDDYMDAVNSVSPERIRPNKWAAAALLARVYLYMGNWAAADSVSTAVINQSAIYSLSPDLNTVFFG